ncbi:GIY-YIG nuclease family protein [Shouchella lehensis]|uniref:Excinuclease ABC, C subunit, N-terminal n=2 Tax=Shouchella lehensis TaxID=300825 RepID=A0A060LZE0_9BACI|nr:GIY-YIG nuclease family protein [Shouchella lehensis]AIC96581.1 Excinuclease ABC, C subunit, N-terminal [Shouchella lehensis G1]MBG9782409.1 endonuclease [Shouchella lehensis]RQW18072.1 GIY-YIG nuclease family protein [Bacillus sp. C1-1]TES46850.1 GIY-YIG nuclease family protein [Shouchella lehensis]
MKHYMYVLECGDQSWYTGYTNNVEQRLRKHEEGKGAKYTRGRGPLKLVYVETFATKKEALKQEYQFKRKTRRAKERYVLEQRSLQGND